MKKKILIFSTSRSDYGILSNLIKKISSKKYFDLKLIITGEHFSKDLGFTVNEIKKDKIKIFKKIIFKNYTSKSENLINCSGQILIKLSRIFKIYKPDIAIVLGDRFETFICAYACFMKRVMLAHFHGGEKTNGSIDDNFRHSISKMSNIHFVERNIYKRRLIQIGENPKSIHVVGSLGRENISKQIYLSRKKIEEELKFKLWEKNFLFTFHPETSSSHPINFDSVLNTIKVFKQTKFIFTAPNKDVGSDDIRKKIFKYVKNNKNGIFFNSLGKKRYLSLMSLVNGVIGNSSSGLIEAPAFNIPTINIGNRQEGRFMEKSIINCKKNISDLHQVIKKIINKSSSKIVHFGSTKKYINTSNKVIKILRSANKKVNLNKEFRDLLFSKL